MFQHWKLKVRILFWIYKCCPDSLYDWSKTNTSNSINPHFEKTRCCRDSHENRSKLQKDDFMTNGHHLQILSYGTFLMLQCQFCMLSRRVSAFDVLQKIELCSKLIHVCDDDVNESQQLQQNQLD